MKLFTFLTFFTLTAHANIAELYQMTEDKDLEVMRTTNSCFTATAPRNSSGGCPAGFTPIVNSLVCGKFVSYTKMCLKNCTAGCQQTSESITTGSCTSTNQVCSAIVNP